MSATDPYRQRVGPEFLRVGIMLVASLLVGFFVGMAAIAGESVRADGTASIDFHLLATASLYGVAWGALAMAPLWNRPLLSGWLLTAAPCVAVGAVLGLLGGWVGAAVGVGVMPLVAIVVRGRLPFVFPRHPPGHCPACGYELHQLKSRRCPECGADVLARPLEPPTGPLTPPE